jgi:cell division protein FtsI (penicillin-binding protein 3)
VTPIQMAALYGALANHGVWVQPHLVDHVRGRPAPRLKRRRVLSAAVSTELLDMLQGVVSAEGTGGEAAIPGYTVAGKTGTAQKLIGGRYSKSDYNASFVAFVPSRDPVVAIIVVVDSPHGKGYYGGVVSAPIVKRIAEAALRYLGVPPNLEPAASVLVARAEDAPKTPAVTPASASGPIVSFVADGTSGTVPDVRGMSVRDALRTLVKLGLNARASGSGVVVAQDPPAGSTIEPGGICRLTLARSAARAPTGTAHP